MAAAPAVAPAARRAVNANLGTITNLQSRNSQNHMILPYSHVLTKLTQAHAQGHLRRATRSRQDRRGSVHSFPFLYVPSVEKKFTVKRLGSLAPGSLSSGMSERTLW